MNEVARHLLDGVTLAEKRSAGAPPARPAADEPDQPVRILPIAALVGFIAFAVVLARVSSRLTDIAGVALFAAALAWLLWPWHGSSPTRWVIWDSATPSRTSTSKR